MCSDIRGCVGVFFNGGSKCRVIVRGCVGVFFGSGGECRVVEGRVFGFVVRSLVFSLFFVFSLLRDFWEIIFFFWF